MRISTLGQHQTGLNAILNQQAKLNKTQQQLATGKKNSTPSDDPLAAARLVDLKQTLEQTKQYQDNIDTAKQRLSLEKRGVAECIKCRTESSYGSFWQENFNDVFLYNSKK